jgi:hypothetical protein
VDAAITQAEQGTIADHRNRSIRRDHRRHESRCRSYRDAQHPEAVSELQNRHRLFRWVWFSSTINARLSERSNSQASAGPAIAATA